MTFMPEGVREVCRRALRQLRLGATSVRERTVRWRMPGGDPRPHRVARARGPSGKIGCSADDTGTDVVQDYAGAGSSRKQETSVLCVRSCWRSGSRSGNVWGLRRAEPGRARARRVSKADDDNSRLCADASGEARGVEGTAVASRDGESGGENVADVSGRDLAPETNPELALDFLEEWFGSLPQADERIVSLFALTSASSGFYPLANLQSRSQSAGWTTWSTRLARTRAAPECPRRRTCITRSATLTTTPARGRGRISDVDVSPGGWLDVDVKEGAFTSHDDVLRFAWEVLEPKGIKPSIVVNSQGNDGGCHFYWLLDEPVGPKEMREVSERMWLLTQAETGVEIDNLSDPNRVLRLPGTVRWSKNGAEAGRAAPVTTQWVSDRRVSLERSP